MRTLFLLPVFLLASTCLHGQIRDVMLAPYKEEGKWGFIDNDLDTVCPAQYDKIWPFSNARARFRKNKKYGYLNYEGKVVIRPVYDHARPFRYGVATVRKRKKSFRIDTEGRRYTGVVEQRGRDADKEEYIQVRDITDYVIRYKDEYGLRFRRSSKHDIDHYYLYDTLSIQFDSIFTLGFQAICLKKDGLFAIIDCDAFHWGSNHVLEQLDFEFEDIKLFDKRGLHHKLIGVRQDGLWGYFDLYSGDIIIQPKYLDIRPFSANMAIVEFEDSKTGYINNFGMEFFQRRNFQDQDLPIVPVSFEEDQK